ncbi:hypothetical protein L596_008784 [Steinernema carpocapsae]|uniref:Uncharacterized protein n=1 Tax=Steinernema carpocapsae TaxID=34508 RepID=A0A4U5PDH6_STECR|nr:hypothetical protein L596_008784 [Steinernema carpocapsae]
MKFFVLVLISAFVVNMTKSQQDYPPHEDPARMMDAPDQQIPPGNLGQNGMQNPPTGQQQGVAGSYVGPPPTRP